MWCNDCIHNLISKLTPNDIYVLYKLADKSTVQTGESKNEIFKDLKDVMSAFQLQQALMRMDLIGLVDSQRQGRVIHYHITNNGSAVLQILDSE